MKMKVWCCCDTLDLDHCVCWKQVDCCAHTGFLEKIIAATPVFQVFCLVHNITGKSNWHFHSPSLTFFCFLDQWWVMHLLFVSFFALQCWKLLCGCSGSSMKQIRCQHDAVVADTLTADRTSCHRQQLDVLMCWCDSCLFGSFLFGNFSFWCKIKWCRDTDVVICAKDNAHSKCATKRMPPLGNHKGKWSGGWMSFPMPKCLHQILINDCSSTTPCTKWQSSSRGNSCRQSCPPFHTACREDRLLKEVWTGFPTFVTADGERWCKCFGGLAEQRSYDSRGGKRVAGVGV